MKKLLFTLAIVGLAFIVNAQPPAGDAKVGEWYGEKVTTDGAVALTEVAARLQNSDASSLDAKIKAKIKDYGFFLPAAAKGKTVVIDGEVKMKTTSVAELKHYAEDAKKSKAEIDAITKPEKELRVTAKGIVIVE